MYHLILLCLACLLAAVIIHGLKKLAGAAERQKKAEEAEQDQLAALRMSSSSGLSESGSSSSSLGAFRGSSAREAEPASKPAASSRAGTAEQSEDDIWDAIRGGMSPIQWQILVMQPTGPAASTPNPCPMLATIHGGRTGLGAGCSTTGPSAAPFTGSSAGQPDMCIGLRE